MAKPGIYEPGKSGEKETRGLIHLERYSYKVGMSLSPACLRRRWEALYARYEAALAALEGDLVVSSLEAQIEGIAKAAHERGLVEQPES